MSLIQYGFQKLVLLNSAGYSRAELPLDDSVSIIAPNNTGKTSLINALQFLLILNKQHMEFGAHSFENTKRFYFPDNSAYILLEILLPSGMAVMNPCALAAVAAATRSASVASGRPRRRFSSTVPWNR